MVSLGNDNMKIIFEYLSNKKNWSESKVMTTIGSFCISEIFGFRFLKEYSSKKYYDTKSLSKEINFTTTHAQRVIMRIKKDLIKFEPIRDDDWQTLEQEHWRKVNEFKFDPSQLVL